MLTCFSNDLLIVFFFLSRIFNSIQAGIVWTTTTWNSGRKVFKRMEIVFSVPEKVVKGTLAFSRDLAYWCIQTEREREQEKRREGNKRGCRGMSGICLKRGTI